MADEAKTAGTEWPSDVPRRVQISREQAAALHALRPKRGDDLPFDPEFNGTHWIDLPALAKALGPDTLIGNNPDSYAATPPLGMQLSGHPPMTVDVDPFQAERARLYLPREAHEALQAGRLRIGVFSGAEMDVLGSALEHDISGHVLDALGAPLPMPSKDAGKDGAK